MFLSNISSALRHPDFVVHAFSELLDNGSIVEHSEPPFCVNPLTVAEGMIAEASLSSRSITISFARSRSFFKKGISSFPETSNLDTTMLIFF